MVVGLAVGLAVGRFEVVGAMVGYFDDGACVGARVGVEEGATVCPNCDGRNVGATDGARERALLMLFENVSAKTTLPLASTNTPFGPRSTAPVAAPPLSVPNEVVVSDDPMTVVTTAVAAA